MYFSQFGYDHWLFEDKDEAGTLASLPKPHLRRVFDKQDGLALVGFNTIPRAITSYSANHSQWRNDDASQLISLNEDTSIEITSPTKLTINAPEVIVNCETSEVNASTKVDLNTPDTNLSGNLTVTGEIIGKQSIAAGVNVTAGGGIGAGVSLTAANEDVVTLLVAGVITGNDAKLTGSITADGTISDSGATLSSHVHEDAEGRPTLPPTQI